jgi:hypothetical protein
MAHAEGENCESPLGLNLLVMPICGGVRFLPT